MAHVGLVGAAGGGGNEGAGGVLPDQLDGGLELVGGNARDGLDALGGVVGHVGLELLKTHSPVLGKVDVIHVVAEHDVQPAGGKGAVGAGAKLQVDVGQARDRGGDAGVDDDKLAAALLLLHHRAEAVGLRPGRVQAPDQCGVGGVGGVGTHGDVADDGLGGDPGRACAAGALHAVVGRAEERGQALHGAAGLLGVAAVEEDLLGAVLLLHAVQLGGDALVSLVPGDGRPLGGAGALGVGADHGRGDALGIVELLHGGKALGAQGAGGVALARLDVHDLAVLHGAGDAALGDVVAHVAVGVLDFLGGIFGDGTRGVGDVIGTQGSGAGKSGGALDHGAARNVRLHVGHLSRVKWRWR